MTRTRSLTTSMVSKLTAPGLLALTNTTKILATLLSLKTFLKLFATAPLMD